MDRWLKANTNPNKRAVLVMHERYAEQDTLNNPDLIGAKKIITFLILSENTETVKKLAHAHIEPNSCIHVDENSAYDELMVNYDLNESTINVNIVVMTALPITLRKVTLFVSNGCITDQSIK